MKKSAVLCILFSIFCCNFSFADVRYSSNISKPLHKRHPRIHNMAFSPVPLCTEGNLICILGNYTFTSNNRNKPIYADYGIMCTSDGGICTNGASVLTTTRTVYQ